MNVDPNKGIPNGKTNFIFDGEHYKKTRPYTRQHQSRAGGQGQYGSWAGAVAQI